MRREGEMLGRPDNPRMGEQKEKWICPGCFPTVSPESKLGPSPPVVGIGQQFSNL